ncbi:LuxR C-terminal-related transcriptional regulator [uncultured Gilvimarinus sp.]|uniref:LuxR C-terminal-related transcriptional regulator n=1 Tax=uncultured Gilvimarinus sp. TaxID=1689143 RepID=UPI0030DD63D3
MIHIQRTETGYRLGNLEAVGLPPRQSQTLLLLAKGLSRQAAADALGCKATAVRNNATALLCKLNASNMVGLITIAFERGNLNIVKSIAVIMVALHTSFAPYLHDADQQPLRPRSRPTVRIRRREENHPTYLL